MLPVPHQIAFLLFALITGSLGAWGFYRLYLRIHRGRPDTEPRWNDLPRRAGYALVTTLTQSRTFRKRPVLSVFHSFIFYGFTFYLLVNLVDAAEGFFPLEFLGNSPAGHIYNALADALSFLVLIGVIALVLRRFLLPARRDFRFNDSTLLHEKVRLGKITRDSVIVSAFILFHVGSRALGNSARLAITGPDSYQPFSSLLSHLFTPANAASWRIFGYWGALGSVLAFLAYFPYSKHIHIFLAPLKYLFRRDAVSGELPAMRLDFLDETASASESTSDIEEKTLGVRLLEDLAWPRLLDAHACIQCNRCQDVCPASRTGKSLSPAALEINKRMELNGLASHSIFRTSSYETGSASPRTLLEFAISPEAVWACTTCGACMEVCPTQNEQMLDIIDIRRNLVMAQGEFPVQLQTAFRGMERAKNPWGIGQEKRMAWADGLRVPTIAENPNPDVLYWVGCAASYDPSAQKTARAFVQLLDIAGVNYAVLGKQECCTGDTARRAGNEYLYQQLAGENVQTLNTVHPKLIVATCPHCMNAIGNEYRQLGGNYATMHHTEYLQLLISQGKLPSDPADATVTYHDPCYLGRHNGIYTPPRSIAKTLGSEYRELDRSAENSFCCGAGGAQFWKEEESGTGRVSEDRFKEVQSRLSTATNEKVLAVGCPFCKSMLSSTPSASADSGSISITVKDIAELLLEAVHRHSGDLIAISEILPAPPIPAPVAATTLVPEPAAIAAPAVAAPPLIAEQPASNPTAPERKKWSPKSATSAPSTPAEPVIDLEPPAAPERKKWTPKAPAAEPAAPVLTLPPTPTESPVAESKPESPAAPERKKWTPKSAAQNPPTVQSPLPVHPDPQVTPSPLAEHEKMSTEALTIGENAPPSPLTDPAPDPAPARKKWTPPKKS